MCSQVCSKPSGRVLELTCVLLELCAKFSDLEDAVKQDSESCETEIREKQHLVATIGNFKKTISILGVASVNALDTGHMIEMCCKISLARCLSGQCVKDTSEGVHKGILALYYSYISCNVCKNA